jgi:hypothetical protein
MMMMMMMMMMRVAAMSMIKTRNCEDALVVRLGG